MILSAYLCMSLDALGIAACEFDAAHHAVTWNRSFTEFFPEHAGQVHAGEPYAENLRRFYRQRLSDDELPALERYVAEGVARHDNQSEPFEFTHRGRRLRVSSLRSPCGGRVRLWHELAHEPIAEARPSTLPAVDVLEYIPDGATIVDASDRILATNGEFRRLYDVAPHEIIVGRTLDEIIAAAWQIEAAAGAAPVTTRNSLRYDGAPLEVELPGNRWRRVIARHTHDGIGYFTHADISTHKRQRQEILLAQEALRRANADLALLASTDALTGLANRRRFGQTLATEAALMRGLSLLLVDVDHFKSVNDRFGHPVGDVCLKKIAAAIEATVVTGSSLVARIGGEEFGIVLGDTDGRDAQACAAAIRQAVARLPWNVLQDGLEKVTVSIGICSGTGPLEPDAMQEAADRALYAAKRNGRDRAERITLPGTDIRRSA